jgi:peptide-methionine (S)-S-oxide reductase
MTKNKENQKNIKTAVFGGGCFWCLEAAFLNIKGVENIFSGYAGGKKENPTYEEVSSGKTGHAEVIKIEYDSKIISYEDLLDIFFAIHDPTTPDRQGVDTGTQYHSIILYENDEQEKLIRKKIEEINQKKIYFNSIVTQVSPLQKFYLAETYHQRYFEKNPDAAYCQVVINPKISKLKEKFKDKLKI